MALGLSLLIIPMSLIAKPVVQDQESGSTDYRKMSVPVPCWIVMAESWSIMKVLLNCAAIFLPGSHIWCSLTAPWPRKNRKMSTNAALSWNRLFEAGDKPGKPGITTLFSPIMPMTLTILSATNLSGMPIRAGSITARNGFRLRPLK